MVPKSDQRRGYGSKLRIQLRRSIATKQGKKPVAGRFIRQSTGQEFGSWTRLVIRNRTGSAWELERVALVIANSLEVVIRSRGLLEYTIRITKHVHEPRIPTKHTILEYYSLISPFKFYYATQPRRPRIYRFRMKFY